MKIVVIVVISFLGISFESSANESVFSNEERFDLYSINEVIAKLPASEIIKNFKLRADLDFELGKIRITSSSYMNGGLECIFSDMSFQDARCWVKESGERPGNYSLGSYATKALCEALPGNWELITSEGEFYRNYEKPAFNGFICKKSWSGSH